MALPPTGPSVHGKDASRSSIPMPPACVDRSSRSTSRSTSRTSHNREASRPLTPRTRKLRIAAASPTPMAVADRVEKLSLDEEEEVLRRAQREEMAERDLARQTRQKERTTSAAVDKKNAAEPTAVKKYLVRSSSIASAESAATTAMTCVSARTQHSSAESTDPVRTSKQGTPSEESEAKKGSSAQEKNPRNEPVVNEAPKMTRSTKKRQSLCSTSSSDEEADEAESSDDDEASPRQKGDSSTAIVAQPERRRVPRSISSSQDAGKTLVVFDIDGTLVSNDAPLLFLVLYPWLVDLLQVFLLHYSAL